MARTDILLANAEDFVGQEIGVSDWIEVDQMQTNVFGEVTRSISQAWPEVEPLECELDSVISRPMRSRLFPPDEPIARTRLSLQTAMGSEEAVWLMPQSGLATHIFYAL